MPATTLDRVSLAVRFASVAFAIVFIALVSTQELTTCSGTGTSKTVNYRTRPWVTALIVTNVVLHWAGFLAGCWGPTMTMAMAGKSQFWGCVACKLIMAFPHAVLLIMGILKPLPRAWYILALAILIFSDLVWILSTCIFIH